MRDKGQERCGCARVPSHEPQTEIIYPCIQIRRRNFNHRLAFGPPPLPQICRDCNRRLKPVPERLRTPPPAACDSALACTGALEIVSLRPGRSWLRVGRWATRVREKKGTTKGVREQPAKPKRRRPSVWYTYLFRRILVFSALRAVQRLRSMPQPERARGARSISTIKGQGVQAFRGTQGVVCLPEGASHEHAMVATRDRSVVQSQAVSRMTGRFKSRGRCRGARDN